MTTLTPATDRAVRRVTVASIAILFVAWIVDYVDRLVIATALPSIGAEFGLDHTQEGLLLTAFFVAYALAQYPGGLLADTVGARPVMVAAMIAWSVFTGLSGLAGSFAMLLAVRVLFGVTEGIFPGASMKAISERTRPAARMTANGVVLASNPFGAALAPLIAAPVIVAAGWRNSFFAVAVAGVVVALVLWFALPRALNARTGRGAGDARPASEPPDPREAPEPRASAPRLGRADLLRRGVLWRFTLLFAGFDLVAWGLTSWVPSYLQTVRHVSVGTSGVLASIPFVCATIGTIVGGLLYDRVLHGRHRLLVVPSCAVAGILLLLMAFAPTTGLFVTFQSLAMLVMYLCFMPIFGLPMRMLPPELAGSAGGLINMGGQLAGAVAPFAMGFLADTFSFTVAFAFLEVGIVVAIVAVLWAPQRPAALLQHFPELRRPVASG